MAHNGVSGRACCECYSSQHTVKTRGRAIKAASAATMGYGARLDISCHCCSCGAVVLGGGWAGGDCGVEVLLAGSSMHSSREGASKK